MIGARVHSHSPTTIVNEPTAPLSPGHPLADTPCPVCDAPLGGQRVSLVVVGAHPDNQPSPTAAPTFLNAATVAVHTDCTWGVTPLDHAAVAFLRAANALARDSNLADTPTLERLQAELQRTLTDLIGPWND